MQILTKEEYDNAVEAVSTNVFDPMGPNADVSNDILDLIDDGRQEEARDRLKQRIHDETLFNHTLGEGPIDQQKPIVLGAILQHSDCSSRIPTEFLEFMNRKPDRRHPEERLQEAAWGAFWGDVKHHVYKRVRNIVND